MTPLKVYKSSVCLLILLLLAGCKTAKLSTREASKSLPATFTGSGDTTTSARLNWKKYFEDEYLIALIDTALSKNQELNITMQEIEITQNEIRARKGEYLPFVGFRAGAGVDKAGEYTRAGAVEKNLEIRPETKFPEPLTDYMIGAFATWEVDIWKKLRNSKKAAALRYLATIEGRNFMVTNLIAEIANSYYELMALDNLLNIVQQNMDIQNDALQIVRQQKDAAKLTQLAVNRFEAQMLNTRNLQYEIKQRIIETENHLHYLTGRFPTNLPRNSASFGNIDLDSLALGLPSQLLMNRPDIRQAELKLEAAKIDVKIARANFYPSVGIAAGVGFNAFKPSYLFSPESMIYNLAGDLMAPLINRNAIKASYNSASARQLQEVYQYEQTVLSAYVDVLNQVSRVRNFTLSYQAKSQEAEILMQSVTIANNLFRSARADYLEVLLTQRDALESKMELTEIKLKQLNAKVNIYKALGGGWN